MVEGDILMAVSEGNLVVSWESRGRNRQRREDDWAKSYRDL